MADIKSAYEIAMEKVANLGSVTEDERREWKYVPEGEKLAAKYLKEGVSLDAALNEFAEEARGYVARGVMEILVRNIDLPRNEFVKKNTKQAMDGLRILVEDKVAAENVFSKIRRVFDHYGSQGEQQKQQAYESLKAEFTSRIQQAMQQQYGGNVPANIDVESQPQFHEEWRRVQAQLEQEYTRLLDEYRQELRGMLKV